MKQIKKFIIKIHKKNLLFPLVSILIAFMISSTIIFGFFDNFFIKKSIEKGFNNLITQNCSNAVSYGFDLKKCEEEKDLFENIISVNVLRIEKNKDTANVQIQVNSIKDSKKKQGLIVIKMKKISFSKWIFENAN